MAFEPKYSTYPGGLVPATAASLAAGTVLTPVVPAGESDSGLPGSKELPSNFLSDLVSPEYRKYPYPPVVLMQPTPSTPGASTPDPGPAREPISSPPARSGSGERPVT